MPIMITLTPWECKIVELLADERHKLSQASEYHRSPGNRENPDKVDRRGVAAELGFCKLINTYPIKTLDKIVIGDPDFIINGKTVDVKGTNALNNDLMVSIEVKHRFDLYVVMAVVKPDIYYLGYSWGDILFNKDRIYHPTPNNDGINRTPFYRVLNRELLTDPFWVDGRSL